MIIYFRDILDEEFISKFVPQIIVSRALLLASSKTTHQMNEYLKKNFKLPINDILKQLKFSTNRVNDTYLLIIDENVFEKSSNIRLISLIKLIDYGNLEVKGLNIINKSIDYVINNIKGLYQYYLMKGGD